MTWRGSLFAKYALPLVVLVSGGLAVSALVEIYFSYQENKTALARVQREKAIAAALRIEQFVRELEHDLSWIAQTPWGARGVPLDQRRLDALRLLRQVPAITEVSHIDPAGREQLRVSRLAMDVIGSDADFSDDPKFVQAMARKTYFSPVYFRKESEPYMTIAIAGAGEDAGVVAAEGNLKFIWDVVSGVKVGEQGYAYVVDARGRLIAHPDISLVLKNTDMSSLPQIRAASKVQNTGQPGQLEAIVGHSLAGREVLAAHAGIESLGWLVFAELPITEAFAPLYASIWRTLGLLLVGVAISVAASLVLVRRMVDPIHKLRAGASKIGAGALEHRIAVTSGDELQSLADEFNNMAGQLQDYYANLERTVEERTRDLREALEQQTATAEILRVISSSPRDLTPVFDSILDNVMRLCRAHLGSLFLYDGEAFNRVASRGANPAVAEQFDRIVRPAPVTALGRLLAEKRSIHIPDIMDDEAYRQREPLRLATVELIGARTWLAVPFIKDSSVVGAAVIYRKEVAPFSEAQISLLRTFADQAVIAIENVRLFTELEDRNKALSEALEQQTATSEILRVISSSPTNLQPVLDAVAESAARLCDASDSQILQVEGDRIKRIASRGILPSGTDTEYMPLRRDLVVGRAIIDRRTTHIPDVLAESDFELGPAKAYAREVGSRTVLAVPMFREGVAIGAISVRRLEVNPFSDKQIALLETFADQAVIAIENVRLFQELESRTKQLAHSVEQLQALAEVSQAVNSTLDLQQVLSTIVTRAVQLSSTDTGAVYEHDEASGELHLRATYGLSPELEDALLAKSLRVGEGATGRAAEERAPVEIADIKSTDAYSGPLRDVIERAEVRSILAVPLLREGRVLGGLTVSRKIAGSFPAEVIETLQTFAAQSAVAIQNARLFREIEQKSHELEIASQHKSQFLANMSHELRTPLNAILGYTELIVDRIYGNVPEKILEVLERVQKSGRHLLGLINDVLDLSKIEAGQLTLSVNEYSFQDVVQSVVSSVESLAREKGLRLAVNIAPTLPVGCGDERRIVQVLLNLVGNAIKFTEAGEVAIRVSREDSAFVVSVSDTGPGIPKDQHQRIFEEFQQVDPSSTRTKGGTGLGLAIAKRIIEMHGGRIWLESTVGRGSIFTFSLPVRAERRETVS